MGVQILGKLKPALVAASIIVAGLAAPALTITQAAVASAPEGFGGELQVQLHVPSRQVIYPGDNVSPIGFSLACTGPNGTDVLPPPQGFPTQFNTDYEGKAHLTGLPDEATCTVIPTLPEHCTVDQQAAEVNFAPTDKQKRVDFTISCENTMTLWVMDEVSGAALPGTTLRVEARENTPAFNRVFETDEQGKLALGYMAPGYYMVTPVKIPTAYSQLQWALHLSVSDFPNEPADHYITIDRPTTSLKVTVTTPSGMPFVGRPVNVDCEAREQTLSTDVETAVSARGTWGMTQAISGTNQAGIVIVPRKPAGSDCKITVEPPTECVGKAVTKTISIPNAPENQYETLIEIDCENKGSVSFAKQDATNPEVKLAGVEFTLASSHNDLKIVAKSDAHGNVVFTSIPWGEYILTETKGLPNYLMDAKPQLVRVDAKHLHHQLASIANTRKPPVPNPPPKLPEPPKPPHPPLPKTGANIGLLGISTLLMIAGVGAVKTSQKRA